MKLKLDENLGQRGRELFVDAGHDVMTIDDEGLAGADDVQVINASHDEQRGLVTLDLDFSNPLIFPPDEYSGIAVIRLPSRFTPEDLLMACATLIRSLANQQIQGKLWIVQRDRVREYRPDPPSA